jgi:hypothetical protein
VPPVGKRENGYGVAGIGPIPNVAGVEEVPCELLEKVRAALGSDGPVRVAVFDDV